MAGLSRLAGLVCPACGAVLPWSRIRATLPNVLGERSAESTPCTGCARHCRIVEAPGRRGNLLTAAKLEMLRFLIAVPLTVTTLVLILPLESEFWTVIVIVLTWLTIGQLGLLAGSVLGHRLFTHVETCDAV